MKQIFTKDIVVVAQVVLTLVHVILVLQEPIAKHVKNILYQTGILSF